MQSTPIETTHVSGLARRSARTALLSLALLGQANGARAADTDQSEAGQVQASEDDAATLVERGIALRRSGEDAQALPLFQRAEQLDSDSVRIQVHLAATYQALGEWEAADRHLTAALRDPADPYVQRHQAVLATAKRAIDAHLGSLLLSGGPPGSEVRLNGHLLGRLPLSQTVRVQAGIYTLDARLAGHYPITRSVALAGGEVAREALQLTPLSTSAESAAAGVSSGGSHWLSWTFGGLAVGAGAFTVAAWAIRERHADTWNDDEQCLAPGQTRQQVCGGERGDGRRAETWMWVGAASTGALAVASVTALWLRGSPSETPEAALSCGVGLGELTCSGRF
jgi:PEGA domain